MGGACESALFFFFCERERRWGEARLIYIIRRVWLVVYHPLSLTHLIESRAATEHRPASSGGAARLDVCVEEIRQGSRPYPIPSSRVNATQRHFLLCHSSFRARTKCNVQDTIVAQCHHRTCDGRYMRYAAERAFVAVDGHTALCVPVHIN